MDFSLTYTQQQLQNSARRLLAARLPNELVRQAEESAEGYPSATWEEAVKLGWPALPVAEDYGGAGCGVLDLCVLAEEIGRGAATLPLTVSAGIAATILDLCPASVARNRALSQIAAGKIITTAFVDEQARNERAPVSLQLISQAGSYSLSGRKGFVPFASAADELLVTTINPEGELAIVLVGPQSEGITITAHNATGGVPLFAVQFRNTSVPKARILVRGEQAELALERGLDVASVLATSEAVGQCETVLKMTTEYVSMREAFGQPIGAFQAVSHPCADMRIDTDTIRFLVREAAWLMEEDRPASVEVATTKAFANDAVERMINDAIRLHGAIGFSNEFDLQLFTRRMRAFCQAYGETEEELERAALLSGFDT